LPFYLLILSAAGASAVTDPVQAIQSTYQATKDITADFTQSTYIAVLEKTVKNTGKFMMKKPGLLRIEYTGEHPKQYISDGKKLWVIEPELHQYEVYKVGGDTIPGEALEFLKGFGEMERLFEIAPRQPASPAPGNTPGNAYLRLTPKSGNAQYKWLDCEFGADNILRSIAIHNKSGNISTYVFSNIKSNTGLDDKLFKWK
jgi:outer membrane lipoprotein carrier protein